MLIELAGWAVGVLLLTAIAMAAFPPLVLLLLPLSYALTCNLVNETEYLIDGGMLRVRHRPLPWPGETRVPLRDCRQLFVERRVTEGRERYDLLAVLGEGRIVLVMDDLERYEQAQFIERELEAHLGIENDPTLDLFDPRFRQRPPSRLS